MKYWLAHSQLEFWRPRLENGTETGRGTETMVKITPWNDTSKKIVFAADFQRLLPAHPTLTLQTGCCFNHVCCQKEFSSLLY